MSADVVVASGGLDCHLMSGCGFPAPGAEIFQFDAVFTFTIGGLEFHITKITILLILCVILILSFFIYAFRKPKLVPRGAQNVGEMGYLFIRDGIAREAMGKEGDKYVVSGQKIWISRAEHSDLMVLLDEVSRDPNGIFFGDKPSSGIS